MAARQHSSHALHAPPPRAPRSPPPPDFNGDSNRGEQPSRRGVVGPDYEGSRRAGSLAGNDDDGGGSGYICATQGGYSYEAGDNNLTPRTRFDRGRTGTSESPSPDRGKTQSPSGLRPRVVAFPGGHGHGGGGSSSWLAVSAAGVGDAGNIERAGRAGWPTKKGEKMDEDSLHCERVEKEIAHRFDIVADGMEKLDNIFSNAAQILEYRVRAVSTIARSVPETCFRAYQSSIYREAEETHKPDPHKPFVLYISDRGAGVHSNRKQKMAST